MKILGIFAVLLGAAFGFFHIVETGAGFTVVPKTSFTFVDTFISVGDVVGRYNNRNFAEALRGDPQLDNLVRGLEKQGFISLPKNPDSKPQTTKDFGATGPEQHSKATTPPTPVTPDQKVNSASKAISHNFGDDTFADLLSILSKPTLHCPPGGTCEIKRFTLEPVDINGDGKNEFIVTHGGYCGSGGCTTLLMAKSSDNIWAPLAGNFGAIRVMAESTKGFRDIQIQRFHKVYLDSNRPSPEYTAAQKFSWSGREYVENGKLEPLADYRDVKAAIFDASNAVGNTINFDAEYRKLGMMMGAPTMLIKVDTTTDATLWNVFFDSSFNRAIGNLQIGQRLSIFCRIKDLSGLISQCDLVAMTVK
jgi:hypothetical protein